MEKKRFELNCFKFKIQKCFRKSKSLFRRSTFQDYLKKNILEKIKKVYKKIYSNCPFEKKMNKEN